MKFKLASTKSKKFVALLMTSLLLISTVGCSNGETATTGGENGSDGATTTISENFNETGLPILKEPETFEIAIKQVSPLRAAGLKQAAIDAEPSSVIRLQIYPRKIQQTVNRQDPNHEQVLSIF